MVKDIAIVIPTHNRLEKLKALLKSIKFNNLKIDTFVVSNLYSEDTKLLCTQFDNTKYFCAEKISVNKARNIGASLAMDSYEYIVFLDDDCILEENTFFEAIKFYFQKNADVHVIGGLYKNIINASFLDSIYNQLCFQWLQYNEIGSNQWRLLGGCLAVRSSVFRMGHFFDEDISYGSSETEFLYRLFKNNIQLRYLSDLSIIHDPELNFVKFFKKAFKQGYFTSKYKIDSFPRRYKILGEPKNNKPSRLKKLIIKISRISFHLGSSLQGVFK